MADEKSSGFIAKVIGGVFAAVVAPIVVALAIKYSDRLFPGSPTSPSPSTAPAFVVGNTAAEAKSTAAEPKSTHAGPKPRPEPKPPAPRPEPGTVVKLFDGKELAPTWYTFVKG